MNKIYKITTNIYKNCTLYFKQNRYMNTQRGKYIPIYGFLWYFGKEEKPNESKIVNNIIAEADELFNNEKYLEAYNLLSTYNKISNSDIDWRICRALYKMSKTSTCDEPSKHAMIIRAYDMINETIKNNKHDANIHKWMAILLDSKLQFESRFFSIEEKIRIKNHLIEANKLNPNDFSVLYMLGRWYYAVCTLTWFQKKLAAFLFDEQLNYNYEHALNYFFKAEELKPRCYISNVYMLGRVNYDMGNMYRAHYYLAIASEMTANTNQEEEYVFSARDLIAKLKKYDVSEEAL